MNADFDKLRLLSYDGEAHGVRFHCGPAPYATGKMSLQITKLVPDGGKGAVDVYKGAADYLAEALNGRWTDRGKAYLLAPSRATLWRAAFLAGWDAEMDWRRGHYGRDAEAPMLITPDKKAVTLAEARRRLGV